MNDISNEGIKKHGKTSKRDYHPKHCHKLNKQN